MQLTTDTRDLTAGAWSWAAGDPLDPQPGEPLDVDVVDTSWIDVN
eukprot:gene54708-24161_t